VRDEDRGDVANLAFEVAARGFDSFTVPDGGERDAAERNWILTITRNAAANWRKTHHQPEQIDVDDVQAPADVESKTAALELARALLWTLPEHLRTMYLWHHLDGETDEEIAAGLALPVGTVKTHLRAAQQKLNAAIDRLCARERTKREDYLRGAMPLPFADAAGLARALRSLVEEIAPGAARRSKPWFAWLRAAPAATWSWIVTRMGRRAGALLASAAIPLVITSHDVLDAPAFLDVEMAPSAPQAEEAEQPGSGRGVTAAAAPDALPAVEARAPAIVRAASAAPASPGPRASSIGARGAAAMATGPAEDRLIRAATRALVTSPERALVLLHEHERRFLHVNVALRNELLRQARAALGAVAPPRPDAR